MFTVPLLAHDYKDRDSADFKHKHLKEVITLTHINPSKLTNDYTPKDLLDGAIGGCPLCSMAVGTSWFRGDLPFDTVRWVRNPLWRKRAQMMLFNLYKRHDDERFEKLDIGAMCQLAFGTNLSTDMLPENDMAGFWGTIHMWMPENLKEWYSRNSYLYTLRSTLGPPPWSPRCSSTGDPEALNIAVWWLKRCLGEHAQCSSASSQADPSHRPARLVMLAALLATTRQDFSLMIRRMYQYRRISPLATAGVKKSSHV